MKSGCRPTATQISGWLKRQFPADQGVQVSHETIYRSLFIQTRGVLKKELMAHLRTARQMRQAKGGTTKSGLGQSVSWAVKVLVGTIRRASAATCSVRGLTFMN